MNQYYNAINIKEKGAAVVEFALLLPIMLPLLVYLLYSSEAGMILLETQEEVISSLWDYSVYPYKLNKTSVTMASNGMTAGSDNGISKLARRQYHRGYEENRVTFKNSFVRAKYDRSLDSTNKEIYTNDVTHRLICGLEAPQAEPIGSFFEGRKNSGTKSVSGVTVYKSGIGALQASSRGGWMVCQTKAQLEDKIIPSKYKASHFLPKLVVRQRTAMLTDTWGLPEKEGKIVNSKLGFTPDRISGLWNWNELFPPRTQFQEVTNQVRNSAVFLTPTLAAQNFSNTARSDGVAIIPAIIDQGNEFHLAGLREAIALPNIMGLNMVVCYPDGGSCGAALTAFWNDLFGNDRNKYRYAPTLDRSGLIGAISAIIQVLTVGIIDIRPSYFTTPLYNDTRTWFGTWWPWSHYSGGIKYQTAFNNRSKFYMGSE